MATTFPCAPAGDGVPNLGGHGQASEAPRAGGPGHAQGDQAGRRPPGGIDPLHPARATKDKVSPRWVPVLMFFLLGLGLVVIFLNYLDLLPGGMSNAYLGGGWPPSAAASSPPRSSADHVERPACRHRAWPGRGSRLRATAGSPAFRLVVSLAPAGRTAGDGSYTAVTLPNLVHRLGSWTSRALPRTMRRPDVTHPAPDGQSAVDRSHQPHVLAQWRARLGHLVVGTGHAHLGAAQRAPPAAAPCS